MSLANINRVIEFWFREGTSPNQITFEALKKWFTADEEFDREIKEKFENDVQLAGKGEYEEWKTYARGNLALVLLLDQFPRNIYRNTPDAYAYDEKALSVCLETIDRKMDLELNEIERFFLYLPMEHYESLEMQELMVKKCQELLKEARHEITDIINICVDYAERHKSVIERFGRFPHRNTILGRTSSDDELKFLAENPEGF